MYEIPMLTKLKYIVNFVANGLCHICSLYNFVSIRNPLPAAYFPTFKRQVSLLACNIERLGVGTWTTLILYIEKVLY